ncbi:uncharacterized protein [Periplaneta americana]|uniref:uncharacterized protein isoform X2 n=1 Tax=Periplaneta americana TaxID=6978 RepID=UPI0037E720DA
MKSLILKCIFLAMLLTCSLAESNNDTQVWITENGEERDLRSRPLPLLALKVGGREEEPHEAEAEETEESEHCQPDMTPTHMSSDIGTAMGKCFIPDSPWSKACKTAMVVNRHYENVVSKVDPEEVARAVDAQQVPLRHTSCQGRDSDSGMVTVECRACTIALKPNSFGVQLTCYECQQGQDDKTCHHTLKENSKFVVSTTFFDMIGFDVPANSAHNTTKRGGSK